MYHLKVVIADDNPPSKKLLSQFIQLFSDYMVVGEAATGEELIQLTRQTVPDIMVIDIDMPGINGIEASKICKMFNPTLQVIFTTSFDEYAVEAFNLAATDYIVKPIERNRLLQALEKARTTIRLQSMLKQEPISNPKLAIKSNHTFLYIPIEEILYIEKEGRKCIVHTGSERIETMESLQELEKRLPEALFYKTHRSYLVNLSKVIRIEAFGETYQAKFDCPDKTAYISKLKINEVHRRMVT